MTQAMDTTLTGDEVIHTHYTLHCSTAKEWGKGGGRPQLQQAGVDGLCDEAANNESPLRGSTA